MVFFGEEMIETKNVPAPLAGERDFFEYLSAMITPAHHV
jgi:hypothetical protein